MRSEDAGSAALDFRIALERQRLILELPLSPLQRSEVEAMVHCLVGSTPRGDILETIVGLTEGNPHFVEEIVRTGVAPTDVPLQRGGARVPRSIP